MVDVTFAIPGDLALPTGGYAYDRKVIGLLPQFGVACRHLRLADAYPSPDAAALEHTVRALQAAGSGPVLIDGLAYGATPREVIRQIPAPIVALVHHPLCLEAGLSPARQAALRASETVALALARRVITTSQATAAILAADFAVPPAIITVAEPGTDAAPRAIGSGDTAVHMLAVGSVVPRKGYDLLVEALAGLKPMRWRLTIAGALDRSPQTVDALRRQIAAASLSDRITLAGAVDEPALADLYHRTDLFVMSSHFEGFGMVLTESMARGLPIVTTTGGAAGDAIPDAAAIKVLPGDARALMWVLGRALDERALRQSLSDAGWAAAANLPRWTDTARTIADVLKGCRA